MAGFSRNSARLRLDRAGWTNALGLAGVATALLLTACSDPEPNRAAINALGPQASGNPESEPTDSSSSQSDPTGSAEEGSARHPPETVPPTASGSNDWFPEGASSADVMRLDEVGKVLESYDRVLTELSANPQMAADDQSAVILRWHSVVLAGTRLDEEVRTRTLTNHRANHMIVRPPTEHDRRNSQGRESESLSWIHSVVKIHDTTNPSQIEFGYCGYSPGVGYHDRTGEVLDDRRATTRGSGRATRSSDGRLLLSSLVDEELLLLGTGEGNPC